MRAVLCCGSDWMGVGGGRVTLVDERVLRGVVQSV
jgi:hypothetical protein